MKIGHTIRMLRTAHRVSQGSLARQLEITAGYLSLVEQDKREPSLGFLNRVGEYFEIPVAFLMLGEANRQNTAPEYQRLIDEIKGAMLNFMVSRPAKSNARKRKALAK